MIILLFASIVLPLPASKLLSANKGQDARSGTSTTTATQCPSITFGTFLDRFSENTALQKKHTIFPLPLTRTEEPPGFIKNVIPSKLTMRRTEANFPLYPSKQEKIEAKAIVRFLKLERTKKLVSLTKDGTSQQIDYHFKKGRDNCWYLHKIDYKL